VSDPLHTPRFRRPCAPVLTTYSKNNQATEHTDNTKQAYNTTPADQTRCHEIGLELSFNAKW